jgi:hypothetical protein
MLTDLPNRRMATTVAFAQSTWTCSPAPRRREASLSRIRFSPHTVLWLPKSRTMSRRNTIVLNEHASCKAPHGGVTRRHIGVQWEGLSTTGHLPPATALQELLKASSPAVLSNRLLPSPYLPCEVGPRSRLWPHSLSEPALHIAAFHILDCPSGPSVAEFLITHILFHCGWCREHCREEEASIPRRTNLYVASHM